jgi:menaquinone-dependent protoporphyrinogen oxidase
MEKVIIGYASKHGYTAEAANVIGDALREKGLKVDVKPVEEIKDIKEYEFVVLGTAVKGEKVLPAAEDFMERFRADLREKPAAYFALSMLMAEPSEENKKRVAAVMNGLRYESRPWDLGLFPGVRDPENLPVVLKWSLKKTKGMVGDFRDIKGMKVWAERLAKKIVEGKPY